MPQLLNQTDEELMQMLAQTGQTRAQAFAVLVERHTKYFFRVGYRIVLEKETAEDIVQSCFLKIWEKPQLWKNQQASFKTWFYRIVCNAAIDDKRRLRFAALPDNVVDDREEAAPLQPSLRKALLKIPARQRAAIMLVYYEEKKQLEAANILGIKLKALESLLSRGKQALKEAIK